MDLPNERRIGTLPASSRSRVKRSAVIASCLGLMAGLLGTTPVTAAAPEPLIFHYTDCIGPAGTPDTFDASKLSRWASGLHVVGSTSMWFLVHVESVATGEVFVDMPPTFFEHFPVPTTTCLIESFLHHELLRATGVFHPAP